MREILVALAFVSGSLPAATLAQTPPPAAAPVAPVEPSPEEIETARVWFREGVAAAQAGRWEEARAQFARTLQIRPVPIVRFNLAVACQNLNRLVEAADLFHSFLRDTPDAADPPRVSAARQQLDDLERRVARLRVEATGDEPREFRLDGRAQNLALLGVDIPIDPGPHRVELLGAAGDRQIREGAVFEGESMRVEVALTRSPAIEGPDAASWGARTQAFGHWVARPGPGGRWVDWAARATELRPSVWRQHPFTFALQLGLHGPTGLVSASVRYFPQPWFGLELAGGVGGAYGPSGALLAHARYTGEHLAVGAMAGLGVGLASLRLTCASGETCAGPPVVEGSAFALTLSVAATVEYRLSQRLSLRLMIGARVLTNPDDLLAIGGRQSSRRCAGDEPATDGAACSVFGEARSTAGPFLTLDVGYSL